MTLLKLTGVISMHINLSDEGNGKSSESVELAFDLFIGTIGNQLMMV